MNEQLLLFGAPVAAHWVAENQVGPLLLTLGTEEQKRRFLPEITKGNLYISAALSEPESGSDLASVRTYGRAIDGGFLVSGQKTWSSNAHLNHYVLALIRTEPRGDARHAGLSQVFIRLSSDGVTTRPISVMGGSTPFAEILFEDVFVPDSDVLGRAGDGWKQVASMLVEERSGPERYLSTFPLFDALIHQQPDDPRSQQDIGATLAKLWATRALAIKVLTTLNEGGYPELEGAIVKDVGAQVEQMVVEVAGRSLADGSVPSENRRMRELLGSAQMAAPGFTIRGGTVQVLRGVIARMLGLR